MNISLLIVDMQKKFLAAVSADQIDDACEHINYVGDLLRASGQKVVLVKDIEGMDESNTAEFEIIEGIQRSAADITITKTYSNAFWDTELEQRLKKEKTDLVIVAGFAAENCVLATYLGAKERGFHTVLLQNGILSKHDDAIRAAYRDRHLISYPVIEALTAET